MYFSMFLKLLVALVDPPVHARNWFENALKSDKVHSDDHEIILNETSEENIFNFSVLDSKKWRIVHIFVAYKSEDL